MNKIEQITHSFRPKEPILILEDTKETQDLLNGLCNKMDIPCVIADNGKIGLQLLEENSFSIYIVDLMMPVMDGRRFILNLKKIYPEAIILVQTALDSSETIIDIMKMGVFDYIIKPIDPEIFQINIIKGLELKYLRDMEKNLGTSASIKTRNQIEWLNYKEERRITDKDYAEIKSIYNLKTYLTQGTGFGSLLTLIDLMKRTKRDEGDIYSIDKQIVDLLMENYDFCHAQLNGLHSISNIMEKQIHLECLDAATLISAIPKMIADVIPYLSNKDLNLTYPELKTNCKLNLNMEYMSLIIEELFINAYKYSAPNSNINIFSHIKEGYFWLSIKNDVTENPYGGIPPEYEKLVVEPFFRLSPPDESIAHIEKFGLGLGLTVVDNIARKHNGIFIIGDVIDHTKETKINCVLAEILLPIVME